jgi:hypothetical protein
VGKIIAIPGVEGLGWQNAARSVFLSGYQNNLWLG